MKETIINPFALTITVVMALLLFFLPRRYCVIPIILTGVLITEGQQIILFNFSFTMLRLLFLCAFIRFAIRREWLDSLAKIDKVFIAYVLVSATVYIICRKDVTAFVNRLGFVWDSIGLYFIFRILLRDFDDIRFSLRFLCLVAGLVAVFMVIEVVTKMNMFSVFGGVPQFSEIREDRIRAQGAFVHALIAGAFGATTFPLCFILWRNRFADRTVAVIGMVGALIMVFTTATSSAIMALGGGIAGLCFWPLRNKMRLLRWSIVITLIGLHIVMKAPVWGLISRIRVFGVSSGYHRFLLVDSAINNFKEWWLWGVKSTAHWGIDMWDTANQFVAEGVKGGLAGLCLFIAVIVLAFKLVGQSRVTWHENVIVQKFYWTLGSVLFAHCVAFWGINYFGVQSYMGWYLLMGCIVAGSQQQPGVASTDTAFPSTAEQEG